VIRFAKALLAQGADPDVLMANARGRTPLSQALNYGRQDFAHLLVQHGADPDRPDGQGQTAWQVARQHRGACAKLRRFIGGPSEHRPRLHRDAVPTDL
jgi:ankyrin repeat protein